MSTMSKMTPTLSLGLRLYCLLSVAELAEAAVITESSLIGLSCLGGFLFLLLVTALGCYCCRKQRLNSQRKKRQLVPAASSEYSEDSPEMKVSPVGNYVQAQEQPVLLNAKNRPQRWVTWNSQLPPTNADLRPITQSQQHNVAAAPRRYVYTVPAEQLSQRSSQSGRQRLVVTRSEGSAPSSELLVNVQHAPDTGYTKRHVLPKQPMVMSQRYTYGPSATQQRFQPNVLTQSRRGLSYMGSNTQQLGHQVGQQHTSVANQSDSGRVYLANYKPKMLHGYSTGTGPLPAGGSARTGRPTHRWVPAGETGMNIFTTAGGAGHMDFEERDKTLMFEEEQENYEPDLHIDLAGVGHEAVATNVQSHIVRDTEEITIIDFVDDYITPPQREKEVPPLSTSTPRYPEQELATLDDVLNSDSDDSGLMTEFRHKRQRKPREGSLERLPGNRRLEEDVHY